MSCPACTFAVDWWGRIYPSGCVRDHSKPEADWRTVDIPKHGTPARYMRMCRCAICRAGYSAYRKRIPSRRHL